MHNTYMMWCFNGYNKPNKESLYIQLVYIYGIYSIYDIIHNSYVAKKVQAFLNRMLIPLYIKNSE